MSTEIQTTVTVDVDAGDWLMSLGNDYLSLFQQEPKIIFCIVFAFMAAQLVHVILRGYFPRMRRLTQALFISAAHIIVGAIVAHNFLQHLGSDVDFYKWFTGVNSIMAFHLLMMTGKYFKLPWLVQALSLRMSKVVIDKNTGKAIVEMGETVRFLRK
jgi:hypothetical protein